MIEQYHQSKTELGDGWALHRAGYEPTIVERYGKVLGDGQHATIAVDDADGTATLTLIGKVTPAPTSKHGSLGAAMQAADEAVEQINGLAWRGDDADDERVYIELDAASTARPDLAVGRDAEIFTPDGCCWFGELIGLAPLAAAGRVEATLQCRYDGPIGGPA